MTSLSHPPQTPTSWRIRRKDDGREVIRVAQFARTAWQLAQAELGYPGFAEVSVEVVRDAEHSARSDAAARGPA
jgi:hypothetical protein